MSEYRLQERYAREVTPIVSNNANFVKAAPGDPILVSWDDAVTMFHEFGHALHGLNSDVDYPTLSGTNVARDFVEFPSQLNEHWLPTHEVLTRFALHYKTGEPMPDALVAKIRKAHTFNKGFDTVEYLASAIVDMKAHLAGATPINARAFEAATLKEIGMPREIVMRLNAELLRVIALPDFKQRIEGDAVEPIGSTPEQLGDYIKVELVKWAKIVRDSGARVD